MTLNKYKLIAFDVDGTLIDCPTRQVIWQLLNCHFGGDPTVNARHFAAYMRGEMTYAEWVALDVELWRRAGATREDIIEVITKQLTPVTGAQETLLALKERGYKLAVISGTLDLTLEILFPNHPFSEVYTNRLWFDAQGHIAGWEATPYDMEGKAQALREIAARWQVPLEQTVFVGDNINDLQVMKIAGLAVAFEPKDPKVAQAAHQVLLKDMQGLLKLL